VVLKYTLLFIVAGPALAIAHPHVWVEMRTDVVFNNAGLIDGVNVEWSFDDGYAAEALTGMDTNGDGEYSQDELAPLTQENISSLKDYDYFTYMRSDEKALPAAPPINAGQTYTDDKLKLHFKVPLKTPFDPHTGDFMVKVYDPEFFIAFDYAKDMPVDTGGDIPADCKLIVKPLPTDAETTATLAMLSTKDKTWKPENGEDFGSIFAQPVLISCKP
jgi:ABC-type uncharacterized transport system substrate-binding protein